MVPSPITRGSDTPRERIAASSASSAALRSGASALSAPSIVPVTRPSGCPWRARIGSMVKPSNRRSPPPFPVTARICAAGTCWRPSFSAVSGAPTIAAPVRMPTEAASDIWSKCPWPMTMTSAFPTSAAAKPSEG